LWARDGTGRLPGPSAIGDAAASPPAARTRTFHAHDRHAAGRGRPPCRSVARSWHGGNQHHPTHDDPGRRRRISPRST